MSAPPNSRASANPSPLWGEGLGEGPHLPFQAER